MNEEIIKAAFAFVGALKIAVDSNGYNSDDTVATVANCFAELSKQIEAAATEETSQE